MKGTEHTSLLIMRHPLSTPAMIFPKGCITCGLFGWLVLWLTTVESSKFLRLRATDKMPPCRYAKLELPPLFCHFQTTFLLKSSQCGIFARTPIYILVCSSLHLSDRSRHATVVTRRFKLCPKYSLCMADVLHCSDSQSQLTLCLSTP